MNKDSSTLEKSNQGDAASYLAAIVACSDDAIISKNLDGIITSWNAGAERIFGYSAKEAIGQSIRIVVPPERQTEEDEIITKLRSGERIDHFETVRVAKDGRRVELSVTVSPIKDAHGKIIGASKVARDITAKKAMEKELREKNLRLEQARQEMEDMTHIASHDLKEPIRNIILQTQFIKEDFAEKLGADGTQQLENLVQLGYRTYTLINELLQFSRLGKRDVVRQEIDLNEVVREIEHLLEVRLKQKHAKLLVPRPLPACKGDKTVITEILRNLITNAVTYNDKPEPVVEVGHVEDMRCPEGPQSHVFYVRDNGIGIPKESQNEIFRLFKRLPSSAKFNPDGTGAGLTFIKKLTERCNGRVWLESELGKGSTFFFTVCSCAEFCVG